MNWRTLGMAAGAGAVLFLIWLFIALATVRGNPLIFSLICAGLAGILVAYIVWQVAGQNAAPPWDFILIAVILGVALPLIAVLYGSAAAWDVTTADDAAKKPPGPVEMKDEGKEPALDDLLAGKAEDWKASLKKAAGILVTAPGDQVAVKRKEFALEPDGSGGGTIFMMIPPANFIRTTLTMDQCWAFYIATARADYPYRPVKVPGLQVGIVKTKIADGKEVVFWAPVPGDVFTDTYAYRLRFDETAAYEPQAELCFQTPSVTAPTQFRIHVRRSTGPLGPNEYMPGIPLARRFH